MVTVKDIYDYIDSFAPFSGAMEFDNTGILIGNAAAEVHSAVAALDVTGDVIDKAISAGAELIISHHPVIFNGLKSIESDSLQYKLIKAGISVISAHTNLDLSHKFGVNTVLAQCLELENAVFYNDKDPIVTGTLKKEMTPSQFTDFVREKLHNPYVRANSAKIHKPIKTVAIGSGACGEYVGLVSGLSVDAFVTGELKHHEFLYADEKGLLAVDAGHFYTENIVILPLAERLSKKFSSVRFIVDSSDGPY